jgi:hypothetical protein
MNPEDSIADQNGFRVDPSKSSTKSATALGARSRVNIVNRIRLENPDFILIPLVK